MVVLNKIYTRTGDDGTSALATGERRSKADIRFQAIGTVDEANAAIGLARVHLSDEYPDLDHTLARIQNDLFDLGADLAAPAADERKLDYEPLRVVAKQVERLESDIDGLNKDLDPLRSFVLPAGAPAAAALHLARAISRRAERLMVNLGDREPGTLGESAMKYINRLSDFLFVAARWVNHRQHGDVLWVPGEHR